MASVEVKNVFKSYQNESKNFVLNGLSLTVKAGEIFSLIGASGCGKTTLLQCILGIKEIDKGSIKVFGHSADKVSNLIGFVPQECQLVPELTIKETAEYFGKIFEMKRKVFESRLKKIFEILQLPNLDHKIENLSGGQKRRISLAIALIHNPKLLILDEPTVGLDPILCDEIWKFLKRTTLTSNLSIVITTHYISEAMKSDCVGFMRNGQLLIEDAPKNIIKRFNSSTLDEAFLEICKDAKVKSEIRKIENKKTRQKKLKPERKILSTQIFSALLKKEIIRVGRQPSQLIFIFIFPLIYFLVLAYSIGGSPSGLKLGILNREDQSKDLKNASGEFLIELVDDIEKIFYSNYDDAYHDARRGKILGFLEIFPDEESFGIKVRLDQTNFQLYSFVGQQIYKAFDECKKKTSKNVKALPVKFEKSFHASTTFKNTFTPPFLVIIVFINSSLFTSLSLIQNRREGFWNLTLLAGVKLTEVLAVQIISTFIVSFIVTTETIILTSFKIDLKVTENFTAIAQILFATYASGSSFGILLSSLTNDFNTATSISMALLIISSFLNGTLWPIEGQFWLLKYFSFLLPTTLPSIALRDAMIRGFDLSHDSGIQGILILTFWTFTTQTISSFLFRKNKFSL